MQIFGSKKSADVRMALRFFAERRVTTHFVDLSQRGASLGELRHFSQKFAVDGLIDRGSKRFLQLGLSHAVRNEIQWLDLLVDEPLMLRMPLVRHGAQLTIGAAEAEWERWVNYERHR